MKYLSKYILNIIVITGLLLNSNNIVYASTSSVSEFIYYYIEEDIQSYNLWDFVDLVMSGESWYRDHIWKLHGYNSVRKNKSKFKKGFDIKKGIKDTLTSNSIIQNNTKSRDGYIFIKKYSNYIGFDKDGKTKLYRLKVVLSNEGKVVTAYPIK